jgi:DNA-binding response OmpR family regulator
VLVVEADPDLQSQMARVLRKEGLRVVATGSGSGALALVSEWDVSLILVSESLPGRSGIDLVRELLRTRPGSRIVMVTNHVEPRFAAAARAAGALGCVVKPLSAEQLPRLLDAADGGELPTRLVPTERTRSNLARRPSALPLTNSALPARGAVAE